MLRRAILIVVTVSLVLLVGAGAAIAATPDQIHEDATDGSIDGTYTLAEMRAADRSVSAEQREYFGWEDVYNAYIRSLSKPNEIPPAVPVDKNKDGKIDAREIAAAKKITRAKCTKATPAAKRSKVCSDRGVTQETTEPDEAEPRSDDNEPASDNDDSNASPLLWLIVGIPIAVVALGAWRMRGRKKGDPNA
jgi:hypothetical protein